MTEKIVRQQSRLLQNYEILLNNKRVKIPVLRCLISFIKTGIFTLKYFKGFPQFCESLTHRKINPSEF